MSFVVRGRPPGTIAYRRRRRGRDETYPVVRRHRRDCMLRCEPFSSPTAARAAVAVAEALGWTELTVSQLG